VRLRPTSIRTRLTLWYTAIFSLVLALYICGACLLHYWQLSAQLYDGEVQDLETVEGLLYFTPDGRLLLHEDYHGHAESRLLLDRVMEVMNERGEVLFRNEKLRGQELGGPPLESEFTIRYFARHIKLSDGTRVLAVSHLHLFKGRPLLMRVGYSTEPLRLHVFEFLEDLAFAMPFALLAAAITGDRMARKALNPLEAMARLTERITASSLSDRIPVENPKDEFGHMARVLNSLLERLEESFVKLKQFTSDVSHELRTPLASLRVVGEVGLQSQQNPAEYQDIIGSMLEEVTRLSSMIDTLLTIAQAESGEIKLKRTEFSLSGLVNETVAIVGVLAEEKSQTIVLDGDADLQVEADRGFLRMALMNLLDNAVKYSPPCSEIRVRWTLAGNESDGPLMVELSVEDQGPGIEESERQHVFRRFYRVDMARNRETGGAGLGLAIAKWAVEAHGGMILLHSRPEGGLILKVRLPATQPRVVAHE
jgi:heavy metal sensor kinase